MIQSFVLRVSRDSSASQIGSLNSHFRLSSMLQSPYLFSSHAYPIKKTQHVASRRISCLTETLPFLGFLHSVLLEPDGVDVDEASCVTDDQSAKASSLEKREWKQSRVGRYRERCAVLAWEHTRIQNAEIL